MWSCVRRVVGKGFIHWLAAGSGSEPGINGHIQVLMRKMFLPVPCAVGKTWLFSLALLSPYPRCPLLLITVQPKALLPREALPNNSLF